MRKEIPVRLKRKFGELKGQFRMTEIIVPTSTGNRASAILSIARYFTDFTLRFISSLLLTDVNTDYHFSQN
jgi:hypothetical protein